MQQADIEQWRIKEEKRSAVQAQEESKKYLKNIISRWAEANRIENFARSAINNSGSSKVLTVPVVAEYSKVLERTIFAETV